MTLDTLIINRVMSQVYSHTLHKPCSIWDHPDEDVEECLIKIGTSNQRDILMELV